ncbi:aminoacyl-tRNA hydrolase [Candidatus Sumerlaeota bacterium]|nr:aminoacyl-tRNA hydrolase [Candidatus Sumerlaeota bacterium]
MQLIVGLGNPGKDYAGTPHNLGFEVLDILADKLGASFRSSTKYRSLYAKGLIGEIPVYLLKPMTYMNLSGEAVFRFLRYHEMEPSDILVVSDDMNLPMGRLRIRRKGSHGGHKGLLSIIELLGTGDFPRLRIGIKPEFPVADYIHYVLSPFGEDHRGGMADAVERAAEVVEYYVMRGFAGTAAKYNKI